MGRFEEIKNEIAKEMGYNDYPMILASPNLAIVNRFIEAAAKKYAIECCMQTLDKASIAAEIRIVGGNTMELCKSKTLFDVEAGKAAVVARSVSVDPVSITWIHNIVLL